MSVLNYIDSHAHIYSEQFKPDRNEAIRKATEAGVIQILMPNVDHTSIDVMLQTEADHSESCLAMMGLHPCSVQKHFEKELYTVESWLNKRKFIAIGETGVDLYWDKTFLPQQQEALQIQVDWAKKFNIPIVLHTREAFKEVFEIIEQNQDGSLQGVFHCFSGTAEEAQQVIKLGFYLGIGGVATFKNGGLDKVLPEVPLASILLETDCPYLAPVPFRGKRNEPAYLPLIAKRVAELKKIPTEELVVACTANTKKLFNL
ncbi:TatD family hydrolase [Adhaeribacter aerolatus]|uniref:TatD family hydrolase n=1 Tax=Adhaeribacter aerolatus TaxID=670289 RepID=A0A512AV77_9BACT|nr:TatD family hydrolase [Adhaeribacter aerolatus]GEO03612.1 TatD family hydrolase [Adhaeribacter aerolatus]